jgi:nucleoside permease NupC
MIEIIIGIGIVAFLILYFSFNLDPEHWLLRLFGALFFIILLILLGKSVLDEQDYCSTVIVNSTTDYTTDKTNYEYERICTTNTKNTTTIFFKTILFFIVFFSAYIIVYLSYKILLAKGMIKRKIK